jgi:hypothetical protein
MTSERIARRAVGAPASYFFGGVAVGVGLGLGLGLAVTVGVGVGFTGGGAEAVATRAEAAPLRLPHASLMPPGATWADSRGLSA